MRSIDGKSLIGPMDRIKEMKGIDYGKIAETDINQIEIEKRVSIDIGIFFSQKIHRLAAKIAFEWYCLNNNVADRLNAFITIFATGIAENQIHSFGDLNEFVCTRFSGKEISISKGLCNILQKEMMESEHYADIIKEGAKIIEEMRFD